MFKITFQIIVLWFLLPNSALKAQEYFPVNGVLDDRNEIYFISNAQIHLDYKTIILKGDLWIEKGKIIQVGENLKAPTNAIVIDVNGAHIYPSFIDLYSNYGIKESEKEKILRSPQPQYESSERGALGWNEAIKTHQEAYLNFMPNKAQAKIYREAGFGVVLSHFQDGIARGTGSLVMLSDEPPQKVMLKEQAAQFFSFQKGSSKQAYPSSLMGVIALLRQTALDAQWYAQSEKNEKNISLQKWNEHIDLPAIFEAGDVLNALRANNLSKELHLNFIIKEDGTSYQKANFLSSENLRLIVPLQFPIPFDVEDPFDAQQVSLSDMKHWETAPANPFLLFQNKIPFVFTLSDLEKKDSFFAHLQKTVEYGLPKAEALKALTLTPANWIGVSHQIGSLHAGKIANFFISSDDIFNKKSKLIQHWINGKPYYINDWDFQNLKGNYILSLNNNNYKITIEGDAFTPKINLFINDTSKIPIDFSRKQQSVLLQFKFEKDSSNQLIRLSGEIDNLAWKGKGQLADGAWTNWEMKYISAIDTVAHQNEKVELPYFELPTYPFLPYGWTEKPKQEAVIFKNVTVWTNESEGILNASDVWIENGKIKAIGKNLSDTKAQIIKADNLHLTSGIIDEHSHIAISKGVNESAESSTAEVQIGHVINSEDINIYRQLSGGVTASQLLHGSANAIGGQSALVKLRWGFLPEQMKIKNADGFIKFALGENVKQSNWGDANTIRFPQTRMGVEQIYFDYFNRALAYEKSWETYHQLPPKIKNSTPAPRRDLELEALLEIIRKKRFITCHSYVQSEINMLMHVADSFDFNINTFTHILEGYKVADKMKAHGASASTFSDWWAYKYEVVDAIPHNAGILTSAGITTAINSDDAEMGRRLNQEAAKSIKYTGMSEEDAWKMITLNPAKILHLDQHMGSIKVGKDADIVLWSGNPLSVYSKVEMTFVDGYRFFDRVKDAENQKMINLERNRLIQKMLDAKKAGVKVQKPEKKTQKIWHCDDLGFE